MILVIYCIQLKHSSVGGGGGGGGAGGAGGGQLFTTPPLCTISIKGRVTNAKLRTTTITRITPADARRESFVALVVAWEKVSMTRRREGIGG